jgi:hypothetical protein
MAADNTLVLVVSGGRRYAVARSQVGALRRDAGANGPALATLLGGEGQPAERYALASADAPDLVLRVAQADLQAQLPRLDLPPWLARQAHPAIVGLVLDDAELLPLIDLGRLAATTGYEPS